MPATLTGQLTPCSPQLSMSSSLSSTINVPVDTTLPPPSKPPKPTPRRRATRGPAQEQPASQVSAAPTEGILTRRQSRALQDKVQALDAAAADSGMTVVGPSVEATSRTRGGSSSGGKIGKNGMYNPQETSICQSHLLHSLVQFALAARPHRLHFLPPSLPPLNP